MTLITPEVFASDIINLNERIRSAKQKLDGLPTWAGTWKERDKIKKKRYWLEDEILHCNHLISIACEGLQ